MDLIRVSMGSDILCILFFFLMHWLSAYGILNHVDKIITGLGFLWCIEDGFTLLYEHWAVNFVLSRSPISVFSQAMSL